MKFGDLDINFKDYLGRMGPGVMVVVSIIYKTKVYEGMYWYTDEIHILEMPESIISEIGPIIEYEHYEDIMAHMKKITGDYKELATKLPDLFDEPPQNDDEK